MLFFFKLCKFQYTKKLLKSPHNIHSKIWILIKLREAVKIFPNIKISIYFKCFQLFFFVYVFMKIIY